MDYPPLSLNDERGEPTEAAEDILAPGKNADNFAGVADPVPKPYAVRAQNSATAWRLAGAGSARAFRR
jgi:hypothetical protein